MPNQGVTKSQVLSNNMEDAYVWEVTQGVVSLFPSFFDGDNLLSLGYAIDKVMKLYEFYTLKRLDVRHASTNEIDGLNYDELTERMDYLGIPYIRADTTKSMRTRIRNWYASNPAGTERFVKRIIYDYIGSGVFYPYDTSTGQADPSQTNLILFASPSSGVQWGNLSTALSYFQWGDLDTESYTGTWQDINTIGKTEIDMQIKFGSLTDYLYWDVENRRADVYRLSDKIMPSGLIYTITNQYDGSLRNGLKLWYRMIKGDGRDNITSNPQSIDAFGNVYTESGLTGQGAFESNSSTYLSGTINKEILANKATIAFWMQMQTEIGTYDRIVEINCSGTDVVRLHSESDFNSGLRGVIGDNTVGTLESTSITSGTTYLVIVEAQSGVGVTTTINNGSGTLLANGFTELGLYSGSTINFGRSYTGSSESNIVMNEFMLWDRLLTTTEKTELYSAGSQFIE